jgi:hypothetical protein
MAQDVGSAASESSGPLGELAGEGKGFCFKGSAEKVGTVNNIIVSPLDSQLVILTGTENVSWISLDCGKTVSVISAGK